jgi:adenylate cyclase class 2
MCQEKKPLEIEVKFLSPPDRQLRDRLKAIGAVSQGRFFESNTLFDDRRKALAADGKLLRLRQDQRCRLTYKSPVPGAENGYKIRQEIELEISDIGAMTQILEALGYSQVLIYEKWRETFVVDNAHICLDTMPFGAFVEIEAEKSAIGPIARALGLNWQDRIVLNYHQIFGIIVKHLGLAFPDITFAHFAGITVDLPALMPQLRFQEQG